MVEITVSGAATGESWDNYLRFTVTLSETSVDVVTVGYRVLLNGTASDDDIYHGSSADQSNGTLDFAPGETSKDIFIRSDSDTLDETDEAIVLELINPSASANFPGNAPVLRAFGVIEDDDGPGSNLAVFVSDPVVLEGDGAGEVAFDIRLSRPATEAFTLAYHTSDLSATAGQDYTATSGTLDFRAGQSVARVVVPLLGDTMSEVSERFALVVEPPDSPLIDTTGAVGDAFILDDDTGPGPVMSIESEAMVETWANYVRFTVTLSEPPVDAVSVSYRALIDQSASDNDLYQESTSNNGTLDFAPGQTSASIYVRLDSDTADERDEAFSIELFNLSENAAFAGGGNTLSTRGIILDDDGVGPNRALFVSDPTLIEGDDGEQLAVFDIILSRPADSAFSVTYATADVTATAGSDYTAATGTLDFAPGQDRASVTVAVAGDTMAEATETFALNITTPGSVSIGQQGVSGLATLLDDDAATGPVASIRPATPAEENWGSYLRFVVTLSEASSEPVTIDYQTTLGTASDDDLYHGSTSSYSNGTLTFDPGQTSASIYIRSDSDTADERDESVFLTLRNAVGATLAGGADSLSTVGFFQDDDGVGLNIALAGVPTTVAEPATDSLTVEVPVFLSRAPTEALSFDVTVNGGTATAGSDFALLESRITFAPGQVASAVRMQINSDLASEGLETVLLNYLPVAGSAFAGAVLDQTVRIRNTEPPHVNSAPDGAVAITGAVRQGATLTADASGLSDVDGLGTFSYQWLRDGTDIAGAGGASLTLTAADLGARISVRVSYTDAKGTDESVLSDATEPVVFVNTPPSGAVAVSGTPREGEILTADASGLTDADGLGTLSYQWLRDGADIAGAGGASLTLTAADIGAKISVRVSYTDAMGTDESVLSANSETVAGGGLTLIGTPKPDTLEGGDFGDLIRGLDENDRLLGGAGDDTLEGGDGADTLNGGDGDDLIRGGDTEADRRDVIYGGDGDDSVDGGYGNDLIFGQGGNDTLAGGFGADELQGQDGDDVITGSAFGDIVFGNAGDDFVNGGFGHDLINGGSGADKFFHTGGTREQMEGHGSDWVQDYSSAEGDVLVFGGAGTADQFQVNLTHTANKTTGERSGDDDVQEAFVIYKPTGQILWALVDGGGEASINLQIGAEVFDLLG